MSYWCLPFPLPFPNSNYWVFHDFDELLRAIWNNKQRMEKSLEQSPYPHVDIVTAEKFSNDIVRILHKFYYKEDERWIEYTTPFPLLKNEIPDEISAMLEE